jgi:hypothetical protein
VAATTRRKVADLDIREHRMWIARDVGLTSVADKTAFFREEAGKHFDPTLATLLVEHQSEAEEIRARHAG